MLAKFTNWWSVKAVTFPHVARLELPVGECIQAEAAVERSLRAQGFIYTELRSLAHEETIDGKMMINMNWKKV